MNSCLNSVFHVTFALCFRSSLPSRSIIIAITICLDLVLPELFDHCCFFLPRQRFSFCCRLRCTPLSEDLLIINHLKLSSNVFNTFSFSNNRLGQHRIYLFEKSSSGQSFFFPLEVILISSWFLVYSCLSHNIDFYLKVSNQDFYLSYLCFLLCL